MPGQIEHRSVGWLIAMMRKILRGKDHTNALRYADTIAARTQPPPKIPGGPYHRISKIYYFTRDARREIQPPAIIVNNQQLALEQGSKQIKPVTPGKNLELS